MGVSPLARRLLVMGPFGTPDADTVAAATAAGAAGVLDLGPTVTTAAAALLQVRGLGDAVGVRVPAGCPVTAGEVLESGVDLVVLGVDAPWTAARVAALDPHVPVLAEVTSLEQATAAVEAGADGVIGVGHEAGGPIGELSAFVLFQQLVAALDVPVWVRGGVGPRGAAGLVAAGAAGVVLDVQLALLGTGSAWPRAVLECMDGSETVVRDGVRVLQRRTPGDPADGLPIGQDGALAALFAEQFPDVRTAVRSVLAGITAALDGDPATGSLARDLGTALAVAQGPMTRVSDRAGFAAAVATGGALPFVALALATGEQAAALLAATAAEVGDRPWGAGILGFAPEEVRSAQLEAVRHVHPPFALLAGGRPAQAAALEADGIATFLHVPSPVLLRQFLAAGARRFVFEGSECGGHVGPRSSLVLWEAQFAELDRFLAGNPADGIQVFLAGGVHDARSAAVVTAMAAPLAARGVGIGVLMGTAYLFTDEAVEHGAITATFRDQAVAAAGTSTVETAPGHVTRCLHSPVVDAFDALRADLVGRGVEPSRVWQELEEFNTGRLRIASKGVVRRGSDLVDVDQAEQLATGMYMAGQVVALRHAPTDIATLHRDVSTGAAELLRQHRSAPAVEAAPRERGPLDVAVVGVSCVLPGAPDVATYWANILAGRDAVTEVPTDRWDPEIYGDATTSRTGAFLDPLPFDPLAYGIPPTSLASIDPAQLLALEVSARALHDAGYGTGGFDRMRTSVIFGAESGGDLANGVALRSLLPSYVSEFPAELDAQLPRYTEDVFPGTLANVIAGRVANRLDLGGTNFTVDAACGSSLAALDVACKELTVGSSDMVLCGAVDLHNGINDYLLFTSAGALSPTGRCRPFDGAADGIALGEGAVCLVLKRLSDAERAGDTVYAVVKGVGGASDGRSMGLTAPRPEGQRRALERAYAYSGVSPAQVELVEAHGTGTVVGDRTELATLTGFFTEAGVAPGTCALGSVKSQIGHTKCTAGLAGLLKAALALRFGVLPPTANVTAPNPAWDAVESPFTLTGTPRPWATPAAERAAGVSAFGFGGTNFHAVLTAGSAATPAERTVRDRPAQLVLLRGADGGQDAARDLVALATPGTTLADLTAEAAALAEESRHPVRWGLVVGDRDELVGLLRRIAGGERPVGPGVHAAPVDTADTGRVAFLFSGQGSQRTGMGAELFTTFGELRPLLDLAAEWLPTVYPPGAYGPEATETQDAALRDTRAAQPAIGLVGLALNAVLDRVGIRPDMLGGHSYGELVALSAAGAFDAATLLRLSAARGTAIVDAARSAADGDTGAMAAVRAGAPEVAAALSAARLATTVVLANQNSPQQTVISGPTPDVDRAVAALRENGLAAKRIPVSCAFHSGLVAPAADTFATDLAAARIRPPGLPVWSNRSAAPYGDDATAVRTELAAQIGSPVRFVDQIESMYAAGARTFVEVGPGSVLTGLVGQILGERPHTVVATDGSLRGLLSAVARLAVAGLPVRPGQLAPGRRPRVTTVPGWTVDGARVRTADGTPVPGSLLPPRRIERPILTATPSSASPAPTPAVDGLVADFLRTSRVMIAAQRDVLLGYLAATGAPAASRPSVPSPPSPAALTAPDPLVVTPLIPAPEQHHAPVAVPELPTSPPAPATPVDVLPVDILGVVIAEIAGRTGYPPDMIDADLDLEADLSVDSIKRTEIVGSLVESLGLSAQVDGELMESLGSRRTAGAIAEILRGVTSAGPAPAASAAPAEPTAVERASGVAPQRFTTRLVDLPDAPATPARLSGASVVVVAATGQEPTVTVLLEALAAAGADARAVDPARLSDGPVDIAVLLGPLRDHDEQVAPALFGLVRTAVLDGAGRVLVVAAPPAAPGSHPHAAGLAGMMRSLRRERPESVASVLELRTGVDDATVAATVLTELTVDDTPPVVIRDTGRRRTVEVVAQELPAVAHTGAGPAGVGTAAATAAGLDADAVVLLVGGARGITAQVAVALAEASRCRVELVGRTPWPAEPEGPATAGITEPAALRAAVAGTGVGTPAAVEARARAILAQREVVATLDAVTAAGGQARYHGLDARDTGALAQIVKDVVTEFGRLDGVVHAAGVIEDKLLADKDATSFARVFATKVDVATGLLDALDDLEVTPAFVVQFGSIAAVHGNRGQIDYAAANDALETIGAAWAERTGHRALTVHWGPWAPTDEHGGMVGADLAREYGRRGIELVDPGEGVAALLKELAYGPRALRAVVYAASGW